MNHNGLVIISRFDFLMIKVLNIMVSSINISWMLVENWIPMARLLNKYIAWNSYRLLDWSLLILSQSLAIVRPLNLCLFINAITKVCYLPLIFLKKKILAYLCIKYMTDGHHKTFLKVVQKGFHYLVYESPSKLLKKDGTFQSNIIGLLFKYCCSKGLSTHAADTVNFQGMIYNLLVNLSNICKIFRITKSILLPTIMYNILSFKIVKHSSLCLLSINKKVRTYLIMRHP